MDGKNLNPGKTNAEEDIHFTDEVELLQDETSAISQNTSDHGRSRHHDAENGDGHKDEAKNENTKQDEKKTNLEQGFLENGHNSRHQESASSNSGSVESSEHCPSPSAVAQTSYTPCPLLPIERITMQIALPVSTRSFRLNITLHNIFQSASFFHFCGNERFHNYFRRGGHALMIRNRFRELSPFRTPPIVQFLYEDNTECVVMYWQDSLLLFFNNKITILSVNSDYTQIGLPHTSRLISDTSRNNYAERLPHNGIGVPFSPDRNNVECRDRLRNPDDAQFRRDSIIQVMTTTTIMTAMGEQNGRHRFLVDSQNELASYRSNVWTRGGQREFPMAGLDDRARLLGRHDLWRLNEQYRIQTIIRYRLPPLMSGYGLWRFNEHMIQTIIRANGFYRLLPSMGAYELWRFDEQHRIQMIIRVNRFFGPLPPMGGHVEAGELQPIVEDDLPADGELGPK